MSQAAIKTEALTKRYGERVAVDHLDLTVEHREVFGLLGPNGAGKTTTILMLLGLSEPTEGRAEVAGCDPVRDAIAVKRRVGYVPDSVGFYEQLTGRENLRFTARLNRLSEAVGEQRIGDVLAEVGLTGRADDRVGTYSRGMRQRLGIADALMKAPEVLILDEPTVAIDPAGVEEVLALIRRLPREQGVTVLLSSHLLQQVQAVCDRIGIFAGGRMVASGTIDELSAGHGRVVIELQAVGGDAPAAIAGVPGVVEVREDAGRIAVSATGDIREDLSRALSARGCGVIHLRLRGEQLGEIYRRHFRETDQ